MTGTTSTGNVQVIDPSVRADAVSQAIANARTAVEAYVNGGRTPEAYNAAMAQVRTITATAERAWLPDDQRKFFIDRTRDIASDLRADLIAANPNSSTLDAVTARLVSFF